MTDARYVLHALVLGWLFHSSGALTKPTLELLERPAEPASVTPEPLERAGGPAKPAVASVETTTESLEPYERVMPDGSRTGSLVYVDAHGDLVRVKYVAGPAAGPRGFQLEEEVVPLASGLLPQVLPPPREVRRAPTPRTSDVFWQPKERTDLKKVPGPRPWPRRRPTW